ncbi:MAG: 30S ribosomal protein S4 [Thermodesulfobacteriota bacterium]
MARYIESVCKVCRREGLKLFFKGDRCYTDKCAFERRSYAPGQRKKARRAKISGYALQLREKQKVKRLYGLMERQFRNTFKKAERLKGVTGENLIIMLERRLDNVVYRLGFADSRREARQLLMHGKFCVNGKFTNIPSYIMKEGDTVELLEKGKKMERIKKALETVDRRGVSQWLELDKQNFKGRLKTLPVREDVTLPIQEQLIVELYSK